MPDTPLNPDALEAAARAANEEGWTCFEGSGEPGNYDNCEDCQRVDKKTATAIVTAYLAVAQPEVSSIEELEALPGKTIVLTAENGIYLRHKNGYFLAFGLDVRLHPESIILPARVLYRPEVNDA